MRDILLFLWMACFVQVAIATANFFIPKKLHYRENLAPLAPIIRQFSSCIQSISLATVCQSDSRKGLYTGGRVSDCARRIGGLPATEWMLAIGAFFLRTETELILKSRRVVSKRLVDAGFRFEFPAWPDAAKNLVERWRNVQQGSPVRGTSKNSRMVA